MTANTSGQLPPACPTIVMDIEHGNTARLIDFDYHSFYDTAKEHDISDDEIRRFTMRFLAVPARMPGLHGQYVHRERTAIVYGTAYTYDVGSVDLLHPAGNSPQQDAPSSLTAEQRGDIVVRHEIGHWVNCLGPRIGETKLAVHNAGYQIGKFLVTPAMIAAPVVSKEWWAAAIPAAVWLGSRLLSGSLLFGGPLAPHTPNRIPYETPAYLHEATTRDKPILTYEVSTVAAET